MDSLQWTPPRNDAASTSATAASATVTAATAEHEPDLVVSAGFMKLAGAAFLERFDGRYINTHPALLTDLGLLLTAAFGLLGALALPSCRP